MIIASSLSLHSLLYRQLRHWSYYISGTRSTGQLARVNLVFGSPYTRTSQTSISVLTFRTNYERNRYLFHCSVQERLSLKYLSFLFRIGTYHPHILNEELQRSDHSNLLWAHCWEPSYWKFGQPFDGEADDHSEAYLWVLILLHWGY